MESCLEQFPRIKEKILKVSCLVDEIRSLSTNIIPKLQSSNLENLQQLCSIINVTNTTFGNIEDKIAYGREILENIHHFMELENRQSNRLRGHEILDTKPETRPTVDQPFSIKLPVLPFTVLHKPSPGDCIEPQRQPSSESAYSPSSVAECITKDLESLNNVSSKYLTPDSHFLKWLWRSKYIENNEFKGLVYTLMDISSDILKSAMLGQGSDEESACEIKSELVFPVSFNLLQFVPDVDKEVKQVQESDERPVRGSGPDTVLCIDTSESMRGDNFKQMKSIVHKLIEGIEAEANYEEIQENIAVVTFGQETKVAVHLTNDYGKVRTVVDNLTVKGQSPIFCGLMTCVSAILGNVSETDVRLNGVCLAARVIIVSDGKFSPEFQMEEIRTVDAMDKFVENLAITVLGKFLRRNGHVCYYIPIGSERSKILDVVLETTKGKIVTAENIGELAFMSKYLFAATRLLHQVSDLVFEEKETAEQEAVLNALLDLECRSVKSALWTNCTEMEKKIILDLAINILWRPSTKIQEPMEYNMEELDPDLPPLGTRVKRGLDWTNGTEDGNGPGTVVGHNYDGTISVIWDCGVMHCTYECIERCEVMIADDERILRDNELINIGCKVGRGPAWNSGDEDGGPCSIGVVCRCTRGGDVAVRWSNGSIGQHRFGEEVCLIPPLGGACAAVSESNLTDRMSRYLAKKLLNVQESPVEHEQKSRNATLSANPSGDNQSNFPLFPLHKLMEETYEVDKKESIDICSTFPVKEYRPGLQSGDIYIVWSYGDKKSDDWKTFEVTNMSKLEAGRTKQHKTAPIQMNGKSYRVVFSTMKMNEVGGLFQRGKIRSFDIKRELSGPTCDGEDST